MASENMNGKRGVIFGVANQRSIAWHIANRLSEANAELAYAYFGDRVKASVAKLTAATGAPLFECDATNGEQVQQLYAKVAELWDSIDFVVHSVAFAKEQDLGGAFSDVSQEGFRIALETSAYSLIPITHCAAPLMKNGGSVVTMTFDASSKVYPGYNIMGTAKAALENEVRQLAAEFGGGNIRVNAISAGPLPTLAARSISGFHEMRRVHAEHAPLKRNITHAEVADAALFLLSDMASGITGVVLPVDAGYGIMAI